MLRHQIGHESSVYTFDIREYRNSSKNKSRRRPDDAYIHIITQKYIGVDLSGSIQNYLHSACRTTTRAIWYLVVMMKSDPFYLSLYIPLSTWLHESSPTILHILFNNWSCVYIGDLANHTLSNYQRHSRALFACFDEVNSMCIFTCIKIRNKMSENILYTHSVYNTEIYIYIYIRLNFTQLDGSSVIIHRRRLFHLSNVYKKTNKNTYSCFDYCYIHTTLQFSWYHFALISWYTRQTEKKIYIDDHISHRVQT